MPKIVALPSGEPLLGGHVRLDLLKPADVNELYPLLADRTLYASGYVMHRRPTSLEDAADLVRRRLLRGQSQSDGQGRGRTAYAVRLAVDSELGTSGTMVGTSALMEAHLDNESVHLGSTLYGARWWGTRVNAETKLLLLSHCFETCGFRRVKIQTDALNTRSQAAISKLGARREGVLRRDIRREDGTFRDTVVFSVLADEWPEVKAGLQTRSATSVK